MKLSLFILLGVTAAVLGCGGVVEDAVDPGADSAAASDGPEELQSVEQAANCTNYTTKMVAIDACCHKDGDKYQKYKKYMCMYGSWNLMGTVCKWSQFCFVL
jgi:hypothetical protein